MARPSTTSSPTPQTPAPASGLRVAGLSLSEALMLLLGFCTLAVSWQVFKLSDLASDVRNTNTRIDQIFPTLVQQSADLGSIKGSLEVSSQKIAIVADKLTNVTDRLSASVAAQEAQIKNVQEITTSMAKLAISVQSNQTKLESIEGTLNSIKQGLPLKKSNYFDGTVVFSPDNQAKYLAEYIGSKNSKIFMVEWENAESLDKFLGAVKESKVDFSKFVWTTKDQDAATSLASAFTKAGIQKVQQ